MGFVDAFGNLANIFGGIAFGFYGVDVDVALILGGKAEFGFLEMDHLAPQQAGDGATLIHGIA
jgi:hypothetical protein